MMRHDLLPEVPHGAIPPHLGRAFLRDVLILAGTLALAALVMLLVLVLPSRPTLAETPPSAAQTPAGLYFRDDTPGGGPANALEAPSLATEVAMTVHGMVTRVTLRQVFHNPTDRWMEGVYVFPLPESSAVDRLTLEIGERRVEGRILEKKEAERVYREAAENGQRAGLVSAARPNVFATAVANIGPGEVVTVEIGYQDAVGYEDGVFALRFPMVVAPRYTPRREEPEVAEAPGPLQPRPEPAVIREIEQESRDLFGPVDSDENRTNPLSLTIELDAGLPLAALRSLYHPVTIESTKDGRQTITLADGQVPANRDFVLEWEPKQSHAPQAAVFAEQVGRDAHLMVMMLPPRPEAAPPAPPRELILVIDTSSSMHGESIDQAKTAVIEALKRLRPQDRFNVIQFNSETFALFPEPVDASVGNVATAWHYVSALQAEGGTVMRPALELALAGTAPEGHLRQVVFLTDAAVSNEAELFEQVAARLGEARLFTVGIGAAPNSYFMRKAAELGRGSFTYIGDLKEVKPRIDALLTKLEQPALTDIRVGWPLSAGKRIEIYPTPLPDLYAGEPVTFTARLQDVDIAELTGQLLVTGSATDETGAEGPWQQRLALDSLEAAPGVAALWARAKLAQIEDGLYRSPRHGGAEVDRAAVRAAALALALEHRLVTRYTSLVAVEQDVARPQGENLDNREIPRDLPEGWDAEAVFGAAQSGRHDPAAARAPMKLRSQSLPTPLMQLAASAGGQSVSLPQTATPAERMAIVGSAYLLLALGLIAMVLYRRRKAASRD